MMTPEAKQNLGLSDLEYSLQLVQNSRQQIRLARERLRQSAELLRKSCLPAGKEAE